MAPVSLVAFTAIFTGACVMAYTGSKSKKKNLNWRIMVLGSLKNDVFKVTGLDDFIIISMFGFHAANGTGQRHTVGSASFHSLHRLDHCMKPAIRILYY